MLADGITVSSLSSQRMLQVEGVKRNLQVWMDSFGMVLSSSAVTATLMIGNDFVRLNFLFMQAVSMMLFSSAVMRCDIALRALPSASLNST